MTWLDAVGQFGTIGGIYSEARSYLRGQAIIGAVRAGASANEILRGLTSVGLGIRRQQGLQLIAAEQERQAASGLAPQLGMHTSSSEILPAPPENWTGQYVHQVTVYYRTRDEFGNYMLHTRTIGLKGSRALTPFEANHAAFSIIDQNSAGGLGEEYGAVAGNIVAMGLTGVWYDTQGRNLPFVR